MEPSTPKLRIRDHAHISPNVGAVSPMHIPEEPFLFSPPLAVGLESLPVLDVLFKREHMSRKYVHVSRQALPCSEEEFSLLLAASALSLFFGMDAGLDTSTGALRISITNVDIEYIAPDNIYCYDAGAVASTLMPRIRTRTERIDQYDVIPELCSDRIGSDMQNFEPMLFNVVRNVTATAFDDFDVERMPTSLAAAEVKPYYIMGNMTTNRWFPHLHSGVSRLLLADGFFDAMVLWSVTVQTFFASVLKTPMLTCAVQERRVPFDDDVDLQLMFVMGRTQANIAAANIRSTFGADMDIDGLLDCLQDRLSIDVRDPSSFRPDLQFSEELNVELMKFDFNKASGITAMRVIVVEDCVVFDATSTNTISDVIGQICPRDIH